MKKLIQGTSEFRSGTYESQKELFKRLAGGQSPDALFITCSDSRINPNLITQTDPGDLFILRNAGNIVPAYGAVTGEMATIEFAVAALNVRDIIICGHSDCGAVKGLLEPHKLDSLPAVREWLRHADSTKKIVETNYADLSGKDLLNVAVQENVLCQLENLRTHPVVAAGLASGKISLHGWTYKIDSGEVFSYDPREGQFKAVAEIPAHPAGARPRLVAAAI